MLKASDMISDLLDMSKHQTVAYTRAGLEASDAQKRQTFLQFRGQCEQSQRKIYEFAEQKGWYLPAGPADQAEIRRVHDFAAPKLQQPAMR